REDVRVAWPIQCVVQDAGSMPRETAARGRCGRSSDSFADARTARAASGNSPYARRAGPPAGGSTGTSDDIGTGARASPAPAADWQEYRSIPLRPAHAWLGTPRKSGA